MDEDPEQALAHARAARDRAARVAAVREAVGVAAYHAGDFAEAARELRAYRRMSGDESYRAVLADCERALGRPDVALRLVAEALAAGPDAEEAAELHLVEAGARRDLGEPAAARLVLEDALGGRPRPEDLDASDPASLRLATAFAELLQAEGEQARAAEWFAVLAAADPAADIEFAENPDFSEPAPADEAAEQRFMPPAARPIDADEPDADEPDAGESVAGEFEAEDQGAEDFDSEVEAEVAELLLEDGPSGSAEDDASEH